MDTPPHTFSISVKDFVLSLPPITKIVLLIAVITYFLQLMIGPTFISFVTLVPGMFFERMYIWTLVTNCLCELHLPSMLVNITLFALFAGRWLDGTWNVRMFIVFVFIVNLGASLLSFAVIWAIFQLFLPDSNIAYVPLHGMCALVAGFSVVVKQHLEDYPFHILITSIRGKMLPYIAITSGIILSILNGSWNESLYSVFGVYVGWCYLRFFQARQDGTIGDQAESFALTSFFPEFLRIPVATVSAVSFRLVSAIGILKQKTVMQSTGAVLPVTRSPQDSDIKISPNPLVAQQRRELANRLIEQELTQHLSANNKEQQAPEQQKLEQPKEQIVDEIQDHLS